MSHPSPWFLMPRPRPNAALRLFCFPHAGGSASVFHTWAPLFPESVELLAVQPPGRGTRFRDPLVRSIHELARGVANAMRLLPERPYALLGHSMGARVALEVARLRREEGLSLPTHFFALGARAPHVPSAELTHHLPEAEFIASLHKLGGLSDAVLESSELMQMVLPVVRADIEAFETYLHATEAPLPVPLSVFRGADDASISEESARTWMQQTSAAFDLRTFPGGHFFLEAQRLQVIHAVTESLGLGQ